MSKHLITELTQTCESCPSQWDGMTSTGDYVYIRYRWGEQELGINADRDASITEREYVTSLGDDLDGYLSTKDMMDALSERLDFSQCEVTQ